MPVILPREHYEEWLTFGGDPRELLALLAPFPADRMSVRETALPSR
jgi:putative SOS response-associated peptidase YedK